MEIWVLSLELFQKMWYFIVEPKDDDQNHLSWSHSHLLNILKFYLKKNSVLPCIDERININIIINLCESIVRLNWIRLMVKFVIGRESADEIRNWNIVHVGPTMGNRSFGTCGTEDRHSEVEAWMLKLFSFPGTQDSRVMPLIPFPHFLVEYPPRLVQMQSIIKLASASLNQKFWVMASRIK